MHSERLADIEKLNREEELSREDAQALIDELKRGQRHVTQLRVFVDGMTAENWRDMRLHASRQIDALSNATESL